jgi:outer membrane scaffolding protein for murein synthesis (MipA/OmpV family)
MPSADHLVSQAWWRISSAHPRNGPINSRKLRRNIRASPRFTPRALSRTPPSADRRSVPPAITGVTVDFYERDGFRVSVKGGYELGRKEDDSDYLRGLGDIDAGGVIGGIVGYERGPFEVYGTLDKTIGGSDGLTGSLGAKASYKYERFIFVADVSGTWADDKHMESYFGITSAQSASFGLAQYDAKAGVKRVDVKGSITYMMTENWLVTGAAGAGFLLGDAKDSPIVKDDVQPFAMLGVAYRF